MPTRITYCNGDKAFVSPVRITTITPTETVGSATPAGQATQTSIVKHGAMVNPDRWSRGARFHQCCRDRHRRGL